jgi:Vault protein inter-alpha-trypsin domain/von Willebrand factor type A domain
MAYHNYRTDQYLNELDRIPSGVFFTGVDTEIPLSPMTVLNPSILSPESIFPTFPHARAVVDGVSQDRSKRVLCLPLLDVAIDVRVDSNIATTRIIQRFTNVSDIAIPEAHYTFPIYDGGAVITFRYHVGDSKVLVGKVLSNEEAKIEYMRAIENMEAAALLEEKTPEVLQTMIGNIPPKTSVKIEITYVNELKPDVGGSGLLVTIPTSVAPRYGTPPKGYSNSSAMVHTGLAIVVAVSCQERIRQIECRSHPALVEMGTVGAPPDLLDFEDFHAQASSAGEKRESSVTFNPQQATVKLSDPNAKMDKDFVVSINTGENQEPTQQSRALLSPSNKYGHSALMVTIKPSELFSMHMPDMDFKGEIIFIADRSGSMVGEKIAGLRNVLYIFLKSLPNTCSFNLWSFGSSFRSLWVTSKQYSQQAVDEAVSHVSGFAADMGGTELLKALEDVVARRSATTASTQVILLTDGQVWDTDKTISFVRTTRSELGDAMRLFVLGIGDTVSHHLIEGLGGVGGGFGEVVGIATPDKWQDRVIRMLKGALMPPTWNCEIDLGHQFTPRDLCVDSFAPSVKDMKQTASESSGYIAAPRSPLTHHFKQQSVFFLLDTGSLAPPLSVMITATAKGNGLEALAVVKATLPVVCTMAPNRTLQHLVVKSALLELDMRVGQQQSPGLDSIDDSMACSNAVLLGKQYSVTSRWTSFVATDSGATIINVIDSYNAPVSGLHLLTSPQRDLPSIPTATASPITRPSEMMEFIGDLQMCNVRTQASSSSRYGREFSPPHHRRAFSPFRDDLPFSDFSLSLDYRAISSSREFSLSRDDRAFSPSRPSLSEHAFERESYSSHHNSYQASSLSQPRAHSTLRHLDGPSAMKSSVTEQYRSPHFPYPSASPTASLVQGSPTQAESGPAIGIDDIVHSQTASGRFNVGSDVREKLGSHFPAGTREAIEANTKSENGEVDRSAVDTIMMTKYIETQMDDKKDLLDLMVHKAVRSVNGPGVRDQSRDDSDNEEDDCL